MSNKSVASANNTGENNETVSHGEGRSCGTCSRIDTSRMVQCDSCDTWFHYECVNVDESIENDDWSCNKCVRESLEKERVALREEIDRVKKQKEQWQREQQREQQAKEQEQLEQQQKQQQLEMERLRQLKEQSQRMHEQFLLLDESIVSHSGELINSGRRSVGAIPKQPMMSTRYETLVASRVQGSKGSGISSLKGSQHSTKTREQKLKALEARQALERKQLDERLQLEEQLSAGLDTDSETSESVQRVENWLNKTHNIENATAMPGNETTLPEYPGRVAKSVRIQVASDSSKSSTPRAALAAATSNIMPTCSIQSSATIPSIPPLYGLQSSGSADPQFAFPLSNPSSTSMCVPSLPSGAFQGSVNLPQNHHQSYPSACPPSSFPVQQYPPVYTTQQPRVAVSQQHVPRSVIGTSQPDLVNYSNPYATQSGSNLPPVSASTPRRLSLFPQQQTIADEVCSIERRLSAEHLAARQTVKDLPKFGGDPEEWPRFIAAYERTARMCDFRNDELLDRLERSLQDRALSTVKSLLLHPDNVPVIMNRLSTLFGNPETIVDTMMKRVKSMPPPKADKLESIIDFGIAVQNLCATILACRLDERLYNATLLQELVESLPINLKMKWATHLQKTGASSLMEFNMWLSKKVDAFSRVTRPQSWNKSSAKHRKDEAFLHLHSEQPSSRSYQNSCPACSGDCTTIENCRAFLDMSKNQRWSVVNEQNICRKCLTRHFKTCSRRVPCNTNGCKYLHHWLLHDDRKHKEQNSPNIPNIPANNAISPNNPISPSNSSSMLQHPSCNAHNCSLGGVLLKYIRVTLHGRKGSITTYAFLDGGSTSTFMEHGLWQDLNLEGEKYPLCISWTAGQGRFEADSVKCSIEISGMQSDERFNLAKVHTVQSLSLPSQTLSGAELIQRYHYLSDIPIDSYANVRPRILLGMDNIRLEYPLDSREGLENEPTAVLTRLGWVVYGPCSKSDDYRSSEKRLAYNYHVCQCDELHLTVKEYFSLDSLGIRLDTNRILSKDDERALALLEKNTNRQGARYETCLLWRYDNVDLPSSKTMALNRHKCLERRLIREPEVAKALQQKILEYETKGYIRQLTTKEENEHHERCWYLPIFPVVNPNKPGKLRIVWDAAAKVGKVSLNSFLLKGPDQVAPLSHVLRRFREYRVAITGDIREMFHQVRINSRDQHCQRFLWNKGSPGEAPTTYVMEVMTFGASCSPSSAQYVKNLNSKRFNEQYPKAADEIENGTYVDDMLCSVETEEEAIDLAKNVRMIHASGGFEIRGWLSNSRNVMEAMGECTPVSKDLDVGSQLATEKVLGMWWDTDSDTFTFRTPRRCKPELLDGLEVPTKREVLRTLMLIYDPLGFLANFLMFLKVLLQEIWRSGIQWDDPINEQQFAKWCIWLKVLQQVENVSIPRCYRKHTSSSLATNLIQIHVFVDASENGYAAVAYLRFEEDVVECAFVTAKTRVAPLKYMSIPRLELQAAVIGARLAKDIVETHRLSISKRFFWSDSRDVLCWLRSDHRRYTKYVGARVGEILEKTSVAEWNWVPTKLNVADEGTKWQKTPNLNPCSRWFKGPDFIWQPQSEWPEQLTCYGWTDTESVQQINVHLIQEPLINFNDHSNWMKLVRLLAYIIRYPRNIRARRTGKEPKVGVLQQTELLDAECHIYRMAQLEEFSEEYALLSNINQNGTRVPKSSALYGLSPFLDERGVLRMKSRISNCRFVSSDTACPILLPKSHRVTTLVVTFVHERYHHLNHETVVNELRQKYYIPKLRRVCNKVHRDCQACKNANARPQPPMMADLPPARLAACSRPFSYAGIDYFGPMQVAVGRRVEKRWGVLITCLVVRAVHIEIAHSLTSSSCIMAIRNFIARRGTPVEIFSDRGTNFVGASRELIEASRSLDQDEMMREFVSADTKWSFLPPNSPHMGGSWERLVQSVKKILNNMNLPRLPTDEVLRNSLLEIEFIINSRPLTYVPIENADCEALTPNHFLLGSSHGSKPLIPYYESLATLKNTWKTSQVYANIFWKRWLKEYLPTIRHRSKWHYPVKPIVEGDIVVIVDSDLPRNSWPKGRVVKVNERNGQVRSATVRTLFNVYERPAVKLAVLDVGATECKQDAGSGLPGGSVTSSTDAPPSSSGPHQSTPSLVAEKPQNGKTYHNRY